MGSHRLCVAFAAFSGLCMLSAMRRHIPLSPSAIGMRRILSVLMARVMSYDTKYPRWKMPWVFGRMFGSVSYVPRHNFGSFYDWGMHHDDPTKWQCLHSPRKREHFTYAGNCSNDLNCIQTWWFSAFDFMPKVACQDYFFAPSLVFSSAQVGRNLVMTTTDCTIRSTAKMAPSRQQVWSKSDSMPSTSFSHSAAEDRLPMVPASLRTSHLCFAKTESSLSRKFFLKTSKGIGNRQDTESLVERARHCDFFVGPSHPAHFALA